jgi:hypothetical protein
MRQRVIPVRDFGGERIGWRTSIVPSDMKTPSSWSTTSLPPAVSMIRSPATSSTKPDWRRSSPRRKPAQSIQDDIFIDEIEVFDHG